MRAAKVLLALTLTATATVGVVPAPSFAVDAPTRVTGRIKDAVSGAPVVGACARLIDPADPATGYGESCAGADGAYTLDLDQPGHFSVRVDDPTGDHVTAVGPAFDIAAGDQLTGQDFALTAAGSVSGLVTDRATGAPLADICPSARAGHRGASVLGQTARCSDASGHWSVRGLPAIGVTVRLGGDATHVPLWASNASTQRAATIYRVKPGKERSAGQVRLHHGGVLTGKITDRAERPVPGAWVELGGFAYRCGQPCGQYAARTDADGRYTITNIDQQRTAAVVTAFGQHLAMIWSGAAADPAHARKLAIRYDRTTRFDAVLGPEARLVVNISGIADGGSAQVDAYTLSGAAVGAPGDLDAPGEVAVIAGLPSSRVKLKVTYGDGLHEIWFDGAASLAQATPIRVRGGSTTTVSVTLPAG